MPLRRPPVNRLRALKQSEKQLSFKDVDMNFRNDGFIIGIDCV